MQKDKDKEKLQLAMDRLFAKTPATGDDLARLIWRRVYQLGGCSRDRTQKLGVAGLSTVEVMRLIDYRELRPDAKVWYNVGLRFWRQAKNEAARPLPRAITHLTLNVIGTQDA